MKDEADNRTLDWVDIESIRRNKPEGATHYYDAISAKRTLIK